MKPLRTCGGISRRVHHAVQVAGVAGKLATFEELEEPTMGAEDFSFLARALTGVAMALLSCPHDSVLAAASHSVAVE